MARRSPSHAEIGVCGHAVQPLVPDFPRRITARVDVLELLAVLECVHRHPEPVVLIRGEATRLDEALERCTDQLLTVAYVIEDFVSQNEEAAVDPDGRLANVFNCSDP